MKIAVDLVVTANIVEMEDKRREGRSINIRIREEMVWCFQDAAGNIIYGLNSNMFSQNR